MKSLLYLALLSCLITVAQAPKGGEVNDHDISVSFNQHELVTNLNTPHVPQNVDIFVLESGKHVLSLNYNASLFCNELNDDTYLVLYNFQNLNPVMKKVIKSVNQSNQKNSFTTQELNKNAKAPETTINDHDIKTFFSGDDLVTIKNTPHVPMNIEIRILNTGKLLMTLPYESNLYCNDLDPGLYLISYHFKYFNPVMKKVLKM